jgi:hypothetical protein
MRSPRKIRDSFYVRLPECFNAIKKTSAKTVLTAVGSTYISEQTNSVMKFRKSKFFVTQFLLKFRSRHSSKPETLNLRNLNNEWLGVMTVNIPLHCTGVMFEVYTRTTSYAYQPFNSSFMHCTHLSFRTCCRPRCTARIRMHVKVLQNLKSFCPKQ